MFLGNTTLAHMCVLAAFMGGLAFGSLAIGPVTRRISRPLAFYGWLEVVIGAYAVAFPFFTGQVQSAAIGMASGVGFGSPAWVALKLVVSAIVLLLPTVIMGGTFPVLMQHCRPVRSAKGPHDAQQEDVGEWLYAANCAGAVAGALLAGFVLVPAVGLHATLVRVGIANVLLGLAGVAVGARTAPSKPSATPVAQEPPTGASTWVVYAAMAVSGATAMVYELVWIRIFAITLGSSTYSFTLMLAAFISGITLGSLTVGLWPALRSRPLVVFAAAELAIGLFVAASMHLYERLPYVFWRWSSVLTPTPEAVWLADAVRYALCFVVMVVPTLFFGMTLPLAIKAVARRRRSHDAAADEHIGADAGRVYGANTVGTLVGAVLTGLVLIPGLGMHGSLLLAIVANMAAGTALLAVSGVARSRVFALAAVVVAVGLPALVRDWDAASFTRGSFRGRGTAPASWEEYRRLRLRGRVVYYREDGVATVAVIEASGGRTGHVERTLMIDGKGEASEYTDMPTQVLSGVLPMALKPNARDALVVGLGSGVTASAVLAFPGSRVDCLEISPAVAGAARHFDRVNHGILTNPRFSLVVEDARTVVEATRKRYDVVINEPSNPWIAGVGNLFSVEYFGAVRRVLRPGGVMIQWFHTYETSDYLVRVILRTVLSVFPHACVFQGSTNDYIILASGRMLDPDWSAVRRRLPPSVATDLGWRSGDLVASLLSCQVLSEDGVRRLAGTGVVNRDLKPILEFQAPRAQCLGSEARVVSAADERRGRTGRLLIDSYLAGRAPDQQVIAGMMDVYEDLRTLQPDLARRLRPMRGEPR